MADKRLYDAPDMELFKLDCLNDVFLASSNPFYDDDMEWDTP